MISTWNLYWKLFYSIVSLVKPYIERLLKWMDRITYMMSALFILTLVYEHGFLISFEEMEMINTLYHFVWIVFLVDISLHLLLKLLGYQAEYRGLAWILSLMLYLTLIPVIFHEPGGAGEFMILVFFPQSFISCGAAHFAFRCCNLSNGDSPAAANGLQPSLIFASVFSYLF